MSRHPLAKNSATAFQDDWESSRPCQGKVSRWNTATNSPTRRTKRSADRSSAAASWSWTRPCDSRGTTASTTNTAATKTYPYPCSAGDCNYATAYTRNGENESVRRCPSGWHHDCRAGRPRETADRASHEAQACRRQARFHEGSGSSGCVKLCRYTQPAPHCHVPISRRLLAPDGVEKTAHCPPVVPGTSRWKKNRL